MTKEEKPINPDDIKIGPIVTEPEKKTSKEKPSPTDQVRLGPIETAKIPATEAIQPEDEINPESLKKDDEDYGGGSSAKAIIIMMVVIIGFFALSFFGFKYYNQLTAANILNIDEMHQDNLEDELGDDEGYVYNGYSFVFADGLWWTEMNKFGTLLKVPLHFGPKDLEEIPIEGEINLMFNEGKNVYVAINPNVYDKYYTLAISELSFNMIKGMDRVPVGSCTEENYICDNRSVISCENNPDNKPVVELAYEEGPGIELIGTCIKVKGNNQYDIVKSVNRILYQWYGIMD